jgi:hypothetical protein
MTIPTQSDLERAICCPSGCTSPADCYALDRSRSYPVQIHESARAVARLYLDAWREYVGGGKAKDHED